MSNCKQRREQTGIGEDERLCLESRLRLEYADKAYHAKAHDTDEETVGYRQRKL